jgi:hypothetical protein
LHYGGGTHHRRFRITRADPVPDRLRLIIGDCVHNLRSTLDHLALALASRHTPVMTPKQIAGSEFPVFGDRSMTGKEEVSKIGCIAPPAQAIIKSLQPHHQGSRYRDHPLWQIHDLDRIDKHRALALCVTVPRSGDGGIEIAGVGITYPGETEWNIQRDSLYFVSAPGDMEVDAVFAKYAAIPIYPDREMRLNPSLPLKVAFAKGSPAAGQSVVPALQGLCDFVGNVVVPQLAKFAR